MIFFNLNSFFFEFFSGLTGLSRVFLGKGHGLNETGFSDFIPGFHISYQDGSGRVLTGYDGVGRVLYGFFQKKFAHTRCRSMGLNGHEFRQV
jgi:hypothetical protein